MCLITRKGIYNLRRKDNIPYRGIQQGIMGPTTKDMRCLIIHQHTGISFRVNSHFPSYSTFKISTWIIVSIIIWR